MEYPHRILTSPSEQRDASIAKFFDCLVLILEMVKPAIQRAVDEDLKNPRR